MPNIESIVEYWASKYKHEGLAAFDDAGISIPMYIRVLGDCYPNAIALTHNIIASNGFEQ